MKTQILKIALIALTAVVSVNGKECDFSLEFVPKNDFKHGAFYLSTKDCKRHNGSTFSAKNTHAYGVYFGEWRRITHGKKDYAPTKLRVRVSNHCYFLEKGGENGFKRSDWRKIDDDTIEINRYEYYAKGADIGVSDFSDIKDRKKAWNVFDMPLNCAEEPQREEWTILQKVDGRWQVTAKQRFIINP